MSRVEFIQQSIEAHSQAMGGRTNEEAASRFELAYQLSMINQNLNKAFEDVAKIQAAENQENEQ